MSFRWVILGAGGIAGKFADAVRRIEGCDVAAVGSRSQQRAEAFAARHNIPAAYGDYARMLAETRPDAAYIATTNNAHAELTKLCIAHGVPVLCEKAMFMSSAEAEEVFALAREKSVFCMEAMWSRFLPAVAEMKRVLDSGAIGELKYAEFAIGWPTPADCQNRFYSPALGGGAAYDLLVYCYELAEYFLGEPLRTSGLSVHWADTGVDESETVVLEYPGCIASLSASIAVDLEERAVLRGTKGVLRMPHPHMAEGFTKRLYDGGTEEWHDHTTENGFVYEIEEAMRCIRAEMLESPCVPHALTLRCARLFDAINATKYK